MTSHRLQPLLLALIILLTLSCVWVGTSLRHNRRRALDSSQNLQACLALKAKIERLRQQPHKFEPAQELQPQLARRVESAGTAAGMSAESFSRIDPETPRRVADVPYQELPVRVTLREVPLRQLTDFLLNLSAATPSLQIREIRLSAPRSQGESEKWNAEIVLCYLLHASAAPEAPPALGS